MRRALLMVFAIAAIMSLGTTGAALAQQHKPSGCDPSGHGSSKSKSDCEKPKKCKSGEVRKNGRCVPAPVKCGYGQEKVDGKCVPTCKDDEMRDEHGTCVPKPVGCKDDEINVEGKCIPRPAEGTCSKADLVLLEDLLKGTGALLCVFLGNNAPNASNNPGGNCPDALLALPLDNLIGACLFLPPADVNDPGSTDGVTPDVSSALAPITDATGGTPAVGSSGLTDLVTSILESLTGLLGGH